MAREVSPRPRYFMPRARMEVDRDLLTDTLHLRLDMPIRRETLEDYPQLPEAIRLAAQDLPGLLRLLADLYAGHPPPEHTPTAAPPPRSRSRQIDL